MQKDLIVSQDMPVEARRQILRDHSDSSETTKYQKPLSPDELDSKRETLTNNAIELSQHEDELNEIKKEFKAKMDPLRQQNKQLLDQIKTRQETVEGTLYNCANHITGFMETYDENGELISTRKLRPEEKQGKLFIAQAANQ